jgi:hypothetical protein
MDDFFSRWNQAVSEFEKASDQLNRFPSGKRDMCPEILDLMELLTDFFQSSTLPAALDRIFFASFLTIHSEFLCRFDPSIRHLDCDFVFMWTRFYSVFQAVATAILPFTFHEHVERLQSAIEFLRTVVDGDQPEVSRLQERSVGFTTKFQQLSFIAPTSQSFDSVLQEFDAFRSAVNSMWLRTSRDDALPPNVFAALAQTEFVLTFAARFVKIRDVALAVNSVLEADQSFTLRKPDDFPLFRRFLEITFRIILLQYRSIISRQDDPLGARQPEASKATHPSMEIIYKILNALSQNRYSVISDLWGQLKNIPYSFQSVAERRAESTAMDKLTQMVHCYAFAQTAILQKIEEFRRVFVGVIRDSSMQHSFQVVVHCLLLLLEIRSLTNNQHVTNAVDSVTEKLSKRVCVTKITSDHRRMPYVMKLTVKLMSSQTSALRSLATFTNSLRAINKAGWLADYDSPFIGNLLIYLDLLLSLGQHGPIDRSFLDRIPAPAIFERFLSVNEDVLQSCRRLEDGTRYEDVLLFKSQLDKKNPKLDLIEIEGDAKLCARELQNRGEAQHILKSLAGVAAFFDQLADCLKELDVEGCGVDPRAHHEPDVEFLVTEVQRFPNSLPTRKALAHVVSLLIWERPNEQLEKAVESLRNVWSVPDCSELLAECYDVVDFLEDLAHFHTEIGGTVDDLKARIARTFTGGLSGFVPGIWAGLVAKVEEITGGPVEAVQARVENLVNYFDNCSVVANIARRFGIDAPAVVAVLAMRGHLTVLRELLRSVGEWEIPSSSRFPDIVRRIGLCLEMPGSLGEKEFRSIVRDVSIDSEELGNFLLASFHNIRQLALGLANATTGTNIYRLVSKFDGVDRSILNFIASHDRFELRPAILAISEVADQSVSGLFTKVVKSFEGQLKKSYALLHSFVFPFAPPDSARKESERPPAVMALLADLEREIRSLPADNGDVQAVLRQCQELQTGPFREVLQKLSSATPKSLIDAEISEIRELKCRADQELNRIRSTNLAIECQFSFAETLELLRDKHRRDQEKLEVRRAKVEELRRELQDIQADLDSPDSSKLLSFGPSRVRGVIEDLIEGDAFLHRLSGVGEPPLDELRQQIAEATILKLRLMREIDRLSLPVGGNHVAPGVLARLTEEAGAEGGDWISPVEEETTDLRDRLRKLQKERDSLFRSVALAEAQRQTRDAGPADVDRMFAELVEMKEEVARTRNLKDLLGTFMAKSDELFRIVSAEITGARGQKKVDMTQGSVVQLRAELEKRMRSAQ